MRRGHQRHHRAPQLSPPWRRRRSDRYAAAMPELPEVETVRRGLVPHLEGRVARARRGARSRGSCGRCDPARRRAAAHRPPSSSGSSAAASTCCSCSIGDLVAVHHLRMTGSFAAPARRRPRTCASATTSAGARGPGPLQRSATLRHARTSATRNRSRGTSTQRLGPEPLDAGVERRRPACARCVDDPRRSRRCCSTSGWSRGSATSTWTRRASSRACARRRPLTGYRAQPRSGCVAAIAIAAHGGDRRRRLDPARLSRRGGRRRAGCRSASSRTGEPGCRA